MGTFQWQNAAKEMGIDPLEELAKDDLAEIKP